jgi:cbb3-type cytochrome oxidase cytochrome c subunit
LALCSICKNGLDPAQPDLSYVGDERPDPEWHLKHFRDPQSVSPC